MATMKKKLISLYFTSLAAIANAENIDSSKDEVNLLQKRLNRLEGELREKNGNIDELKATLAKQKKIIQLLEEQNKVELELLNTQQKLREIQKRNIETLNELKAETSENKEVSNPHNNAEDNSNINSKNNYEPEKNSYSEGQNVFNGLSVGVNGVFNSTTLRAKVSGVNYDALGSQDELINVTADYGVGLGKRFVVLFGGSYDLNDTDIFSLSGYGTKYSIKQKNHFSLYLAPGYEISNTTLGYIKLAYHHSEFDTSNNRGLKNYEENIHGYGLGFGIRAQLQKNIFANVEIQRVMYNSENIVSTNLSNGTTIGLVGLSYNFSDNNQTNSFSSDTYEFKGFNIGINANLKSSTTEVKIADLRLDGTGKQSTIPNLSFDYTVPVSNRIALILGASVDLTESEVSKVSFSGNNLKVKEKNHYSFYLAPGYLISDDSILYAKVGYHRAKLKVSENFANNSFSQDISGYSFGAGIRTKIYDRLYSNLEIQKILYDSQGIPQLRIEPGSLVGSVGISYLFK